MAGLPEMGEHHEGSKLILGSTGLGAIVDNLDSDNSTNCFGNFTFDKQAIDILHSYFIFVLWSERCSLKLNGH
jgi:hypothetical protein